MECIAIFLAEVCFVCSKEASHRNVSFEHTEHTHWRKKIVRIGVYRYFPSRSMFCLLKKGVSSRRFFWAHRTYAHVGESPSGSMFCFLKRGVASRHSFWTHRQCVLVENKKSYRPYIVHIELALNINVLTMFCALDRRPISLNKVFVFVNLYQSPLNL